MEATHRSPTPHNIALLPPPGFLGHLIPFIELAKKLVSRHNCTVTLIIPHDGSPNLKPQKSLLQSLPTAINPVFLPPVSVDDQSKNTNAEILLPLRIIRSLPALRATLSSLQESGTPAAALVVDLFAPHAIDVAREFQIPAYIFHLIAATDLSLAMDLPKLDESCTSSEYEPIKLSGSIILTPEDLPDSMKERNSEVHKWMVDLCKKYLLADGILVNSFLELEPEAFQDLEQRRPDGIPPVYPVGPLIRTGSLESESGQGSECLKWLNNQPPKSVLFVSFGSGGTLSMEQFSELALGLEMSAQRFLWVVRSPQQNIAAAYLNPETNVIKDPLKFLPEGFLERTRDRGLVVASWAPQIQVLGHGSTGGFVTHCGWNSILESVVFGVPLIAWPLCFEHKMNAVFLTDGLKAAIRVRENENGIVERGYISEIVKQLMEGEEGRRIRNTMVDIKVAAGDVISQEGSSAQALAQVVNKWINGK